MLGNNQSNAKPNIDKILQTKDKAKQGEIFLSVANAPVWDLLIRLDGRTGQISFGSMGGKLELAMIYKMLDGARDLLHQQELQAVAQKPEEPKSDENTPQ
jgi:hypothetical protein